MKHFHPFRLDSATGELWRGDVRLPITMKAAAVLDHLVSHAGELVTKQAMMAQVWPETHVQEDNLKVYIRELRRALGDDARRPAFIETHPRRGYRFIGALQAPHDTPPLAVPRLVARDEPLRRLRSHLEEADAGRRQFVFLSGEAGIGKTALCEVFTAGLTSAAQVRVARGQCVETSSEAEPYYPVLDALTDLYRDVQDPLVRALEAVAPAWLAQLPGLSEHAEAAWSEAHVVGHTPARMVREFNELLERITRDRLLVLIVEDLHWSDRPTLELLDAVARRQQPARLLIVGTYRTDEAEGHPIVTLASAMRARGLASDFSLAPLSAADIHRYVLQRVGSPTVASTLAPILEKLTGGLPFFVVTATDHVISSGLVQRSSRGWELTAGWAQVRRAIPDSLHGAITRSVDRLPEKTRRLLQAAAFVGSTFTARTAAAAAGIDAQLAEQLCEHAAMRKVIESFVFTLPGGTRTRRYRFRHVLYPQVLRDVVAPGVAIEIHGRIARHIEQAFAGRERQVAGELAWRFEAAHELPEAVCYLAMAAATAAARAEPQHSVRLLRRALRLAESLEEPLQTTVVLFAFDRLGHFCEMAGDASGAVTAFEALAVRARQAGKREIEVDGLVRAARASIWLSRDQALDAAARALEAGRAQDTAVVRAEAELHTTLVRMYFEGWHEADAETCDRAMRQLADLPAVRRAPATAHFLFLLNLRSDYDATVSTAGAIEPLLIATRDVSALASLRHSRAVALLHLGEWGDLRSALQTGQERAEKNAAPVEALLVELQLAWLELEAGAAGSALERCRRALPRVEEWKLLNGVQMARVFAGTAALLLGARDEAASHLEWLEKRYASERLILDWFWRMPLHIALAECRLAAGDIAGARRQADAATQAANATPERTWRARARATRARVALAENDAGRALHELAAALRDINALRAPLARWRVWQGLAEVHEVRGLHERAASAREQRNVWLETLAGSLPDDDVLAGHLRRLAASDSLAPILVPRP